MYERIEKLLIDERISRRQLAQKINVPITTLNSAFKRKSKSLSVDMIKDIAKVLDVPLNFLIGNHPFDNLEVLLENKKEILSMLSKENFLQGYGINDLDDKHYFILLDTVVASITINDVGLFIYYKNIFKDMASPPEGKDNNDVCNAEENIIDPQAIEIMNKYMQLDDEGKAYVARSVDMALLDYLARKRGK